MNTRSRISTKRKGAAAVELAIVLLLFLTLVFGMVEFSRVMMVNQILVNSAREACRYAVVPNSTDAALAAKITTYMDSAAISPYTTSVQVNGVVASLATAQSQDEIRVTISANHSDVSLGIMRFIAGSKTFRASVVMRKE